MCAARRRPIPPAIASTIRESVDRRRWRYLSPVDKQWTWQDSPVITAVRELLVRLNAETDRDHPIGRPKFEQKARNDNHLMVLRMLAVATSLTAVLEREKLHLVLELRAREVSWELIASALKVSRQSAHEMYGREALHNNGFQLAQHLEYELDAARRVALAVANAPDSSAEDRDEARDFLEDSNANDRTTKSLQRRYR